MEDWEFNMKKQIWTTYEKELTDFEEHLISFLKTYETEIPKGFFEGISYSLLLGGKKLRPLFFLKTAEFFGAQKNLAYKLATAIEIMHTFTLVHDDLPAIDNDDMRRNKPSNHVVFGEDFAIINGDAMLNLAYELILSETAAPFSYFKAASLIADCLGVKGVLGGQYLDMYYSKQKEKPSGKIVRDIHKNKTAKLFVASITGAAILAGIEEKEIEKVKEVSENIGLLFQSYDDLLDHFASSEEIGKTANKDLYQNKATYISVLGIDEAIQIFYKLHEQINSELILWDKRPLFLIEFIDYLKDNLKMYIQRAD